QRGGWDVIRIESSDAGKLVVLLSAKETDQFGRRAFEVDPNDPADHLDVSGQGIPAPGGFQLKRYSQTDVLIALSKRAADLHESNRFSGAVLISKDNKTIYQKSWGLADRETGEPINPSTKFRIGSMNKMFTAVAILQLVSEGKVSL